MIREFQARSSHLEVRQSNSPIKDAWCFNPLASLDSQWTASVCCLTASPEDTEGVAQEKRTANMFVVDLRLLALHPGAHPEQREAREQPHAQGALHAQRLAAEHLESRRQRGIVLLPEASIILASFSLGKILRVTNTGGFLSFFSPPAVRLLEPQQPSWTSA